MTYLDVIMAFLSNASAMALSPSRSEKLSIRIAPDEKRLLQTAARARRTSISQFVLDAAMNAADEALAQRNRFALTAEQWGAFIVALDAPPRPHARLSRLLNEPTIFD